MGITGHLAFACKDGDEDKIIAILKGSGGDSSAYDRYILYQPDFPLVRENYWEIHTCFQALAHNDERLAALANFIEGGKFGAHVAMGTQYVYDAETVRAINLACSQITEAALDTAIMQTYPDMSENVKNGIKSTIEIIKTQIEKVSRNNWSMVAGMF
jgi:hypothetical protein